MDPTITCNMRIENVLARWPRTRIVFRRLGLECLTCHQSRFETIGEGARVHDLDLEHLLAALNQAASQYPFDRFPLGPPTHPTSTRHALRMADRAVAHPAPTLDFES